MKRYKAFALSLVLGFSLVGCGSSGGDQNARCGSFIIAADMLLIAKYELYVLSDRELYYLSEAFDTPVEFAEDVYKARYVDLELRWADRVLQAPEGCFPEKDIDKAREYQAK